MSNTDKAAEALRLAEYMRGMVHTYPQMSEDEPGGYCTEDDQCMDQASALLREYATLLQAQPAEAKHIQRLEAENAKAREIIDQLCACHDELECPAVAVAREWLADAAMTKEQKT